MKVVGSYGQDGYAHLQGLIEPSLASTFVRSALKDVGRAAFPVTGKDATPRVIGRPVFQIHSDQYPALRFFLWGLTPLVGDMAGAELLPFSGLLRFYRAGDVCKIHSDRASSEHGLSLTLEYSDGEPWPLEVGKADLPGPQDRMTDGFDGEDYASIAMGPGDGVLYRGTHRRHGRLQPNPNRWSAHLFLFWVERDGPWAHHGAAKLDADSPVRFG
jgi:hypothetical protein